MAIEETSVIATQVVRALSGGRWTWPPVRATERYPVYGDRIRLGGTPIRSVISLTRVDTEEPVEFAISGGSYLVFDSTRFCGATAWSRSTLLDPARAQVEVVYEYGAPPSAAIGRAIDRLAQELELSVENPDECRLPERITSVSRQGVSWTLLDPQDFLTNGRTGLYEVDLALAAANRGAAKARSRIFSVEYPPGDRRATEILSTPS